MFSQVHCPETLNAEELDRFFEQGWFRMGQTIFTTNFLNFKNQFYSAIWLRVALENYSKSKTQEKLAKQNKKFRIEIGKASITTEKETLYSAYKQSISFQASASLHTLLWGKATYNIYNTQEVTIYDGDKLIAVGFFDLGKVGAAGIISFYDPKYKKYSLGKYLIYVKMNYCKSLRLQFFYPGYFVPNYRLFDYKLEMGKAALEYFELASQLWKPIHSFSKAVIPLQVMYDKLYALQKLLGKPKIQNAIFKYEFFDANLIPELHSMELFDFPLFLQCSIASSENIIVYDVRDQQYHWIKCTSVWTSNSANVSDDVYSSHVLKFDQGIFSTEIPEAMVALLEKEINAEVNTIRPRYI